MKIYDQGCRGYDMDVGGMSMRVCPKEYVSGKVQEGMSSGMTMDVAVIP